jgi:hypothetical protein
LNNDLRLYGLDEEAIEGVVEDLVELEREVAEAVERVLLVDVEEVKTEVDEAEVVLVLVVDVVVHKESTLRTQRLSQLLVRDMRSPS